MPAEVATAFELDQLIAQEVRQSIKRSEFPLVLSGNCNSAIGTISGAGADGLGIIWFDGHADFNTPKTTTTGFTDGMGLAIAVGHCWNTLAKSVPGFVPVPEVNVVLVGARDIEPAEQERLDSSYVTLLSASTIRESGLSEALEATLKDLRTRVDRVYVHLDLDVLDPEKLAPANEFAPSDGLFQAEVEAALRLVRQRFTMAAAGIASYDPAFDAQGEILRAVSVLTRALVAPHTTA
ncbi:arginase family protein [soil metagenome]